MIAKPGSALLLLLIALSSSAADTGPGQQAETKGFHSCQKAVEDLAKFLIKGKDHQSFASTSHVKPDTHLFNALVPIKRGRGAQISIMNVAPTKDGTCDSTYTNVFVGDVSCEKFRQDLSGEWKPWGTRFDGIAAFENGPVSLILVPVGAACLVLHTQVNYGVSF